MKAQGEDAFLSFTSDLGEDARGEVTELEDNKLQKLRVDKGILSPRDLLDYQMGFERLRVDRTVIEKLFRAAANEHPRLAELYRFLWKVRRARNSALSATVCDRRLYGGGRDAVDDVAPERGEVFELRQSIEMLLAENEDVARRVAQFVQTNWELELTPILKQLRFDDYAATLRSTLDAMPSPRPMKRGRKRAIPQGQIAAKRGKRLRRRDYKSEIRRLVVLLANPINVEDAQSIAERLTKAVLD